MGKVRFEYYTFDHLGDSLYQPDNLEAGEGDYYPAAEYEKLWKALDEIDRDGPLTGEDAIGFREIARAALGR